MARLATSGGRVDFEQKEAKILGTTFHLQHSGIDDNILKKLGLQDVSEEEKQIIMSAFYVIPPKSTSILSLHDYPQIKKIVIPLLVDLIHDQNPDIQILKKSAMEEPLVEIVYEKKNNKTIGLSILLPSYLLQDTRFNTSQMIEVTGIKKGLEYGKVNINISNGAMTKKASLGLPGAAVAAVFSNTVERNAVEEFKKRTNRNRLALVKRRGEPLPPLSAEEMDMMYTAVAVTTSVILQENIDFYENRNLPPDERERLEMAFPSDKLEDKVNLMNKQNLFLSFFTKPRFISSFHTQMKTKNTRKMLELLRIYLYTKNSDNIVERTPTRNNEHVTKDNTLVHTFYKDIRRYNYVTFIFEDSKPYTYGIKQYMTDDEWNKKIFPIISNLPPYLSEIVFSFHQGIFDVFSIGIMNDKDIMNDNYRTAKGIKMGDYGTRMVILQDRIVFHNVRMYEQIPLVKKGEIVSENSQFIGEITIEIDRATLNGFIQCDKYDIHLLVTSFANSLVDQFEAKHARNFEIASRNAKIRVLDAMLKQMVKRMKDRLTVVTKMAASEGLTATHNTFSKPLSRNLMRAPEYEARTLHELITILEPDDNKKRNKLRDLQSILDQTTMVMKNGKEEKIRVPTKMALLIDFAERYFSNKVEKTRRRPGMPPQWYKSRTINQTQEKYEAYERNESLFDVSYEIPNVNMEWYHDSKMIPPDILLLFDVHPIIRNLKDQPTFYHFIYKKFMEELEARKELFIINYREKRELNNEQNKSLSTLLSGNELSELLDQIEKSRAENATSMFSFFSGYFRRNKIVNKIKDRSNFNDQLYAQTISSCHANIGCAIAAAHYILFQKLINGIGLYLRDNVDDFTYREEKIDSVNCTIFSEDKIFPEVKKAENAVKSAIQGNSPEDAHLVQAVVESAVKKVEASEEEVEVAAEVKAEAEDVDAAFVAVAAAAAEDDTFAQALPEHPESVAVAVAEIAHEDDLQEQLQEEQRRTISKAKAIRMMENERARRIEDAKQTNRYPQKQINERKASSQATREMMEQERTQQMQEKQKGHNENQEERTERRKEAAAALNTEKGTRIKMEKMEKIAEKRRVKSAEIAAIEQDISNTNTTIATKTVEQTELSAKLDNKDNMTEEDILSHQNRSDPIQATLLSRMAEATARLNRATNAKTAYTRAPGKNNEFNPNIFDELENAEKDKEGIRAELLRTIKESYVQSLENALKMVTDDLSTLKDTLDEKTRQLRKSERNLRLISNISQGGSLTKKRNQKQHNHTQKKRKRK